MASFCIYSVLLYFRRPGKEKLLEVTSKMKFVLSSFFGPLGDSDQFRAYRTELWGPETLLTE